MKAVAIVSGGLDSVTLAHFLKSRNYELHLLSFDYGQRHKKELTYAQDCAWELGAKWDIVDLTGITGLLAQSGSTLVDLGTEVPEGHYAEESMKSTVVPNRNAIMLSIATGVAVAENAVTVAIGVHAGDHFVYPDCRTDFIINMSHALAIGNEGFINEDFSIYAPFVSRTKTDIAKLGRNLGVDFTKTWSCYKGGELHCGRCGTCTERKEALEEALGSDPTEYE